MLIIRIIKITKERKLIMKKFYILLLNIAVGLFFLFAGILFQRKANDREVIRLMNELDSVHQSAIDNKQNEIDSIKINLNLDRQKIVILEKNLEIIEKQRQKLNSDYEKIKNDIIAATDSDDWNWFTGRFPKQR